MSLQMVFSLETNLCIHTLKEGAYPWALIGVYAVHMVTEVLNVQKTYLAEFALMVLRLLRSLFQVSFHMVA
jgi:hypothetical protein